MPSWAESNQMGSTCLQLECRSKKFDVHYYLLSAWLTFSNRLCYLSERKSFKRKRPKDYFTLSTMQRNIKFLKFNLKTMMLKAASWEKFISERLKAPTSMFTLFKVFVDFAPKNIFIGTQDKLFWKVIQFFHSRQKWCEWFDDETWQYSSFIDHTAPFR